MARRVYESYVIPSAGQPAIRVERHTSQAAAIRSARAGKNSLYLRSGGRAVALELDPAIDPEAEYPVRCLYTWIESAEGGYRAY